MKLPIDVLESPMKLPIYVLGFERGGTTLLRRLVSMHPGLLYDLRHEDANPLLRAKTMEEFLKAGTRKSKEGGISCILSGMKMPYGGPEKVARIIRAIDGFLPGVRALHILRDPQEVLSSLLRVFHRNFEREVWSYFNNTPKVLEFLRTQVPDSMFISFTQLTEQPALVLDRVYTWMGEAASPEHIEKVISTKGPWEHNGRIMPGLRYFDRVMVKPNESVLTATQQAKVREEKKRIGWDKLLEESWLR